MSNALKGSDQPLQQRYRLALLDLDGVVYRGNNPVPYAAQSILAAEHGGMTIEYTTNNSSRLQRVVADQLRGFGLKVEPWQVITSSVVAARMLARQVPAHSDVLVLGARHLREEVAKQGLHVVSRAQDHPVAAIQGWYPEMTWQEMAEISFAVEQGALYCVTNRDLTIPRELGIAPGCGSMIQAVINATGVEPVASAGKPESAMYDEARALAARDGAEPVDRAACLAIGDRLDTDIEAGNRGGYDSLAVLTGVTNPRELMLAPAALRPSYIALDLRSLGDAMVKPRRIEPRHWQCADAEAKLVVDEQATEKSATPLEAESATMTATARPTPSNAVAGSLSVSGPRNVNALRAACALMWSLADEGVDASGIELPSFDLPIGR